MINLFPKLYHFISPKYPAVESRSATRRCWRRFPVYCRWDNQNARRTFHEFDFWNKSRSNRCTADTRTLEVTPPARQYLKYGCYQTWCIFARIQKWRHGHWTTRPLTWIIPWEQRRARSKSYILDEDIHERFVTCCNSSPHREALLWEFRLRKHWKKFMNTKLRQIYRS